MHQHIYLTGYRGTGKTSVGRILADELGMPLVDLDDLVEQVAGESIREIFEQGGESAFRDIESECLAEVSQRSPAVVSLGGGAILREENRDIIAATGTCIWLEADARTLVDRIQKDATTADRRPALTSLPAEEEVRQVLADRDPLYRQAADHQVETKDKSLRDVAQEILASLA